MALQNNLTVNQEWIIRAHVQDIKLSSLQATMNLLMLLQNKYCSTDIAEIKSRFYNRSSSKLTRLSVRTWMSHVPEDSLSIEFTWQYIYDKTEIHQICSYQENQVYLILLHGNSFVILYAIVTHYYSDIDKK